MGGKALTVPGLELRCLLVLKQRHAYVHLTPAAGANILHQSAEARVRVNAAVRDEGRVRDGALREGGREGGGEERRVREGVRECM